MTAYYNEHDGYAAQWIRNLIDAGHIALGVVDERDIRDVQAADLRGFSQVHLFAGIAGWSYALRMAGWPDSRPVWTASCPCQPFSVAGARGGVDDERHLWPEVARLVRECAPSRLFGEQVASPDGLAWFDIVQADLENAGYAAAALDICAASVGAPHIRQRLYWVADAPGLGHDRRRTGEACGRTEQFERPRDVEWLADMLGGGCGEHWNGGQSREQAGQLEQRGDDASGMGLADRARSLARRVRSAIDRYWSPAEPAGGVGGLGLPAVLRPQRQPDGRDDVRGPGGTALERTDGEPAGSVVSRATWADAATAFWGNPNWLFCRDGKWRPVESGTFPLAHGISARMGKLRAFGNAIVPPLAASYIEAYMTRE